MRPLELGILTTVGNITLIYAYLVITGIHTVVHTDEILVGKGSALNLVDGIAVGRSVSLNIAPPPLAAHSSVNVLGHAAGRTITLVVSMSGEYLVALVLLQERKNLAHMLAACVADERNMSAQDYHLGLGYVGKVGLEPGPLVVGVSAVV